MSPVLNIRLFGHFELGYDGLPITHVKSGPAQSLLTYLLLHRDIPVTRQQLAHLLWPDSTEAQARTNLRREIHLLRRLLPDAERFLHIEAQVLLWRAAATFTLDVADFEAGVAQVKDAEEAGDSALLRATLEKVVALYSGDLLPHCYDDWIAPERERLSQVYAGLLERLILVLEQQREYTLALDYAQRLRRYDPLHEPTYRHLMRLYALHGDRAQALRIYHACVTILRRELDVDPSPTTHAIYEQLIQVNSSVSQAATPPVTPTTTSAATGGAEGRLVGRRAEWARVQAAWHKTVSGAQPGPAGFVLIRGDAGIGKTRLIEELTEWANRQGITTASTRCYAAEGQLAYGPVADWLATEAFRAVLRAVDEVWLTEVVRLLPGLAVGRPNLPRPAPLTESGQRLRLFKALAQVVLSEREPLLLVLDDLQWCDRETLEWLRYLLRSDSPRPLLLVGAARTEEEEAHHPLRTLTLDLRRTEQVTEVELGPLDRAETAALAAQVVGRELEADVASQLYAETEGHPLFVVELARAGLVHVRQPRSSLSSNAPADVAGTIRPLSPSILPPKAYALVESRLAQLSPQARALADIAATIGRSFTYSILAQASASVPQELPQPDEETLVRGLDELWQRRIIREQVEDAYDFRHDKIREVVYAGISRARQRLLHRRVAQALEIVHTTDLDSVSAQIAAHYARAGRFPSAVIYFQRAAEVARRVYANQAAKALYARAIETGRRSSPALDAAQLLPLYEGRAQVCRSLTQLGESIADFHVMRRLARAAGNRQKEGESLCQLAYTHWLSFSEDQMPFVEQYAQAAADLFAPRADSMIRARSLTMLGAVDQVHGRLDAAGQKLEAALATSRQEQDQASLVQTLSFLCLQAHLQGNPQATVQLAQEGVTVARAVQDDFNELRIAAFLCQGLWGAGQYAQAFRFLHETMAHAQERENTFVHGRLLNTLGWFHHELHDFGNAIAYNQRSIDLGRTSGIHNVEISAIINLGYDYLALGQLSQALACLEPTLARVEREGFGAHKWRWQMKIFLGLAQYACHTGAYEQALRYGDACLEQAVATSSHKYVAKGWALRGAILAQMGKTEVAGAELQRALALAEQLCNPSLTYPLTYALGQWYQTVGQARQAADHFGKARALVEQMATALEDEALADRFRQSAPVQKISDSWARTL